MAQDCTLARQKYDHTTLRETGRGRGALAQQERWEGGAGCFITFEAYSSVVLIIPTVFQPISLHTLASAGPCKESGGTVLEKVGNISSFDKVGEVLV